MKDVAIPKRFDDDEDEDDTIRRPLDGIEQKGTVSPTKTTGPTATTTSTSVAVLEDEASGNSKDLSNLDDAADPEVSMNEEMKKITAKNEELQHSSPTLIPSKERNNSKLMERKLDTATTTTTKNYQVMVATSSVIHDPVGRTEEEPQEPQVLLHVPEAKLERLDDDDDPTKNKNNNDDDDFPGKLSSTPRSSWSTACTQQTTPRSSLTTTTCTGTTTPTTTTTTTTTGSSEILSQEPGGGNMTNEASLTTTTQATTTTTNTDSIVIETTSRLSQTVPTSSATIPNMPQQEYDNGKDYDIEHGCEANPTTTRILFQLRTEPSHSVSTTTPIHPQRGIHLPRQCQPSYGQDEEEIIFYEGSLPTTSLTTSDKRHDDKISNSSNNDDDNNAVNAATNNTNTNHNKTYSRNHQHDGIVRSNNNDHDDEESDDDNDDVANLMKLQETQRKEREKELLQLDISVRETKSRTNRTIGDDGSVSTITNMFLVPNGNMSISTMNQQQQQQYHHQQQHPLEPWYKNRRLRRCCIIGMALFVLGLGIITIGSILVLKPTSTDKSIPTLAPTSYRELIGIQQVLESIVPYDDLYDIKTSYHKAMKWIINEDPLRLQPDAPHLLQRYFLVVLYYATTQDQLWEFCNPPNPNSSNQEDDACFMKVQNSKVHPAVRYLTGYHECEWFGIHCDEFNQINYIDLGKFHPARGPTPAILVLLPEEDVSKLKLPPILASFLMPPMCTFSNRP